MGSAGSSQENRHPKIWNPGLSYTSEAGARHMGCGYAVPYQPADLNSVWGKSLVGTRCLASAQETPVDGMQQAAYDLTEATICLTNGSMYGAHARVIPRPASMTLERGSQSAGGLRRTETKTPQGGHANIRHA